MKCVPNTEPFPSKFSLSGIDPVLLEQRVSCGAYPGYYPQDQYCTTYYDQARIPPIIGGCNYDLGVNFCTQQEIRSYSSGCASVTEDYVGELIKPMGTMVIGLSMLNFLCMLIACCMWWKRKEFDIFPEFKVENNVSRLSYFLQLFACIC
jgi:hypothetical protein